MLYRIRWTSKFTGAFGFGSGKYPYTEAKNYADWLNRQPGAVCNHTVELCPDDDVKTDEPDTLVKNAI